MVSEKIIKKIDEGIFQEEEAVNLCSRHIETAAFFCTDEKKQKKIVSGLRKIAKDSRRHKEMLTTIKRILQSKKENQDKQVLDSLPRLARDVYKKRS